jgi:cystathionine beta-lyase/cystathionine gamma-synthase
MAASSLPFVLAVPVVMPNSDQQSPETILQHLGEENQPFGAVVPPIYQSSLFTFDRYDDFVAAQLQSPSGPPFHYSRLGNPNLHVAEKKLAALERTESAKLFGTGMGAIGAAVMSCIGSGSHVVAVDASYRPVRLMLDEYLSRFGVSATYVDGRSTESVLDALRPETTLVYLESPSSIIFTLQDFEAITAETRRRGIATIADNTYSTPLYQNPIEMGVDLVVHSATKYLAGHSDMTAGVVCGSQTRMDKLVREEVAYLGATLAPFPAWLLMRGMRTLALRVRHHERSGNLIADWLSARPEVEQVFHVGHSQFPQRGLFKRQMRGSGGLLSFKPANQDPAYVKRLAERLRIFRIGVSWGGFESLVIPISMRAFGRDEDSWLIRLYCGLEDPGDLIGDLEQAFRKVAEA